MLSKNMKLMSLKFFMLQNVYIKIYDVKLHSQTSN